MQTTGFSKVFFNIDIDYIYRLSIDLSIYLTVLLEVLFYFAISLFVSVACIPSVVFQLLT